MILLLVLFLCYSFSLKSFELRVILIAPNQSWTMMESLRMGHYANASMATALCIPYVLSYNFVIVSTAGLAMLSN